MNKIHDNFTAREYAYAKTIDCIKAMHAEAYRDDDLTPAQVRELRQQFALLHNKLLETSKLDGVSL